MGKLLYEKETYQIIGLCMEVYNVLGFGFSEIVYKDALEIEGLNNNIAVYREKAFKLDYKGNILPHFFIADFVMFDSIIVEIKASPDPIRNAHIAQTLNYLKASGCKIGLIINFGRSSLENKRLIV